MDTEQSYFSISRFFDTWVRVMELHTRKMEVEDSEHWGSKILVISPPTDPGIRLLAKANQRGDTVLLCFSERLKQLAVNYSRQREMEPLDICVAPAFRLPFRDGELAAIYANCFFDFCQERDFAAILDEMWRALQMNGSLFMVYMGVPNGIAAKAWSWGCRRFQSLSRGCHPVSIGPVLSPHGFQLQKDLYAEKLGFPVRYTYAKKQSKVA